MSKAPEPSKDEASPTTSAQSPEMEPTPAEDRATDVTQSQTANSEAAQPDQSAAKDQTAKDKSDHSAEEESKPDWQPLNREQRRIVGVLAEKAKTTPDAYPLTLNALTTGCNQKSNRYPKMELDAEDVELELEKLKRLGAVTEIQGSGRTSKYRHNLYQWLEVDKVELAVMAELLLRGEQTLGELRGRAARMESIAGISELKPIVRELTQRGLVQPLTPEGRGQIVSHALYLPQEQEKIERRVAEKHSGAATGGTRASGSTAKSTSANSSQQLADMQAQIKSLQEELERLVGRVEKLESGPN